MSFCKDYGKDKVIFMTKEELGKPSSITLPLDDTPRGLILPDGTINWNCPCIGSTASGPCGFEFREAFSCFHYSKSETKGSECLDKFTKLNECMAEFPTLYERKSKHQEDEKEDFEFDRNKLDEDLKALDEIQAEKDKKK